MDTLQFIRELTEQLKELPGEHGHSEAMPLNRPYTNQALQQAENLRHSAVGMILYPAENTVNSVLIRRPAYDGTHSNQVAFPGGKMDETDHNLEATARRECHEEINLPAERGICLGELSRVYIPVSRFLVQPFVFYVEELPELIPDPREVAGIIHFDIFRLTDEQTLKFTDMRFGDGLTRKNIPYYDINGHVVWGATAMMLAEFKTILKRF